MKNTIENKAKFFAQYFGQNVHTDELYSGKDDFKEPFVVDPENTYGWLELTPLSSITPEHAIEVCKLISIGSFFTQKKWDVSHVENGDASYVSITSKRSSHIFEIDYDGILHVKDEETFFVPDMVLPNYLPAFQYLTSKGYALPFHNLSVDELISYGWIKLKE